MNEDSLTFNILGSTPVLLLLVTVSCCSTAIAVKFELLPLVLASSTIVLVLVLPGTG
jgi:hypothetical protein